MKKSDFGRKIVLIVVLMQTCISNIPLKAQMEIPVIPLTSLQLAKPFTITYRISSYSYNNDNQTSEKMKATLSFNGKCLLYRNENLISHVIHTVLYDGHETYEMDSNSMIAEIESGFDFSRMLFCPLPGVGIPYMPLFSQGVLKKELSKAEQDYLPYRNSETKYINKKLYKHPNQIHDLGFFLFSNRDAHTHSPRSGIANAVSVETSGSRKILWYDTFDNILPNLGMIWEFLGHEKFQGLWLANIIRMRYYATLTENRKNTLLQEGLYTLESATNVSLQSSAYDPETYLPKRANIGDMTGSTVRSFLYTSGKGSLQTQRKDGREISEALAINTSSKTNTGLIGFFAVITMTIVWFIWKQQKAR